MASPNPVPFAGDMDRGVVEGTQRQVLLLISGLYDQFESWFPYARNRNGNVHFRVLSWGAVRKSSETVPGAEKILGV